MDEEAKKTTLRRIPYAIFILGTTSKGGEVNGAIVSWVTQCSFKPPLVAIGVKEGSKSHAFIEETGTFALNLLAEDQKDLAVAFFKDMPVEGDKMGDYAFRRGATGVPLFTDLAAYVECRVIDKVAKGDHTVFVGEVVDAGVNRDAPPLTHANTGWHYGG